jgi:hypothetical protein
LFYITKRAGVINYSDTPASDITVSGQLTGKTPYPDIYDAGDAPSAGHMSTEIYKVDNRFGNYNKSIQQSSSQKL